MPHPPQILAMGGGGFSMEPDNLALDRYLLSLCAKSDPKVCFVGTATGDWQGYIDKFYAAFRTLPCTPSHLTLFNLNVPDPRSFLLDQDVIYVGGGSTRNLLVLWREYGLDLVLREAWAAGIVLAGISAGALCWFESGVSDSVRAGELHPLSCLGFLPGSFCPHYDGEPNRRPVYHRLVHHNLLPPGHAADDGAALHFTGTSLTRAVSSRPAAKAYTVRSIGDQVVESTVETHYLGESVSLPHPHPETRLPSL